MKLGGFTSLAALLAPLLVGGCGSSGSDTLFGSTTPGTLGGFGGVGNSPPIYYAGSGGQLPQGGAPIGGSLPIAGTAGSGPSSGGFGGSPPPPPPSGGGSGGLSNDGGSLGPGGTAGVGGSDAGVTPPADGPFNPVTCNFSGTWASYVAIDVTWPGTIVLMPGEGKLQQWNLTHEVQEPLSTTVTAHTRPCGIFLPDLQTTILGFFQKFGIRFPNALFDNGSIPETDFTFTADITKNPITFETNPFAIVIGASLSDAVTAPWPAVSAMTLRDDDNDGNPGITVTPVTTNGYSLPPANLLTGDSAKLVYIATRTVSALSGRIVDCNRIEADVTIQTVNGMPGINSSVVGCLRTGNPTGGVAPGPCAANESDFIDGARPQFTPKGPGKMTIVRVAENTTCSDVRGRFPLQ
jgi:hypothetical protein